MRINKEILVDLSILINAAARILQDITIIINAAGRIQNNLLKTASPSSRDSNLLEENNLEAFHQSADISLDLDPKDDELC